MLLGGRRSPAQATFLPPTPRPTSRGPGLEPKPAAGAGKDDDEPDDSRTSSGALRQPVTGGEARLRRQGPRRRGPAHHDNRRWQSGPHLRWSLEMLRGGARPLRAPRHPHVPDHGLARPVRDASRPAAVPQPGGGVRDELAAFGARLREAACASPPTPASTSSSTPRSRRSAPPPRATSRCRPTSWTPSARPEAVACCTSAARPAGSTPRWSVSSAGSSGSRTAPGPGSSSRTTTARSRSPTRWSCTARTGLRVVWDILHHHCNDPDGIPDREALSSRSPPGRTASSPKIHYSTPKTAMEERKKKVGRRVERSSVLPQLRRTPT